MPVRLDVEGHGEIAVPLDGVEEAMLLVRNVDLEGGASHRYSYSAQHDRSFPVEVLDLGVERVSGDGDGTVVSWQTVGEQDLVGFNILRRRVDNGVEAAINPVWIPALGLATEDTSYRFVDRSAEADARYTYRIQAITTSGLSAFTEGVPVSRAPSRR